MGQEAPDSIGVVGVFTWTPVDSSVNPIRLFHAKEKKIQMVLSILEWMHSSSGRR